MIPTIEQRLAVREKPPRKPLMYQSWRDLLFVHWAVEPDFVQAKLPLGLTVDCFDGNAYLGVVSFSMRNIRFRGTPSVPGISNFLELNLRTYVSDRYGNPGVWFFSLDCDQPLAVWAARNLFHLPYEHASMSTNVSSHSRQHFCSRRLSQPPNGTSSQFDWTDEPKPFLATPGTLEFFLVERYLLFSNNRRGMLFTGQVHHSPYQLHNVSVHACETDIFELNGFSSVTTPFVHVIGTTGVDVNVYSLTKT
jgi:uncharacterized protein